MAAPPPPDLDDVPFDEPLDPRMLEGVLRARLKEQRHVYVIEPAISKVLAEVRLAQLRYPLEVLAMLEPIAEELADRAGFVVIRQPDEESDLLLEFSLLPVDPTAAPLSLRTGRDDYVTMTMGVAGEVEFFGRGDDRAASIVWDSIEPYVRAVTSGGLREAYWVEGFVGSSAEPLQSKTHLFLNGKWRRKGAVGVRQRGTRVEREYAPYRPTDPGA